MGAILAGGWIYISGGVRGIFRQQEVGSHAAAPHHHYSWRPHHCPAKRPNAYHTARLASALRLAKQTLEETNRHRWTQDDQDCYISTLFDHIKRDNRWSCVEDVAVYICAMFRLAENNMDYMGLYGQTAYSL